MLHQPKGVGFHGEKAQGKVEPSSARELIVLFMDLDTTKVMVITNRRKNLGNEGEFYGT
jgi:hypothetical protein